jgi:hypothetical protein
MGELEYSRYDANGCYMLIRPLHAMRRPCCCRGIGRADDPARFTARIVQPFAVYGVSRSSYENARIAVREPKAPRHSFGLEPFRRRVIAVVKLLP